MTDQPLATYARVDDHRAELRFARELAHSPGAVWRALTDPGELTHWFPCSVEGDLAAGGALRFVFPDGEMGPTTGEVLEADPPRLLVLRWETDVLRFALSPSGPGTRLEFTHTVDDDGPNGGVVAAARTAAGWDGCLLRLDHRLAATPAPSATDGWAARNEAYLARFAD